jgi:hypothetical protein
MQFGYFTLSDNHYDDKTRGAFIADIIDEAIALDGFRGGSHLRSA